MFRIVAVSVVLPTLLAVSIGAQAQTQEQPGVITGGSVNVTVGGQAAANKGAVTDGASSIVQGSSNVLINGAPAATVGDRTSCGGIVVGGSSNVFVNGRPLARSGDLTTGCPSK